VVYENARYQWGTGIRGPRKQRKKALTSVEGEHDISILLVVTGPALADNGLNPTLNETLTLRLSAAHCSTATPA
jgi:hypothetical protein